MEYTRGRVQTLPRMVLLQQHQSAARKRRLRAMLRKQHPRVHRTRSPSDLRRIGRSSMRTLGGSFVLTSRITPLEEEPQEFAPFWTH
jgi:uncharacterized protein with von Willebrand factor type A (vWA) domain